jgi:hypothetical protein
MAWIQRIEHTVGSGRMQPTQVIAHAKVFTAEDGAPVLQIDTLGSPERKNPGKQSQTLQFGREAAEQLFAILQQTFNL